MRETILEERDGAVVVLTMNRPRQRNAFNRQMWHELRDALLPATIGWQRAAEVLLTADWIDARRAVELGIASRLCAPDELLPAVRAVAARIALQPRQAVQQTKRLLMATRGDLIRAARAREDRAFAERVGSVENL